MAGAEPGTPQATVADTSVFFVPYSRVRSHVIDEATWLWRSTPRRNDEELGVHLLR